MTLQLPFLYSMPLHPVSEHEISIVPSTLSFAYTSTEKEATPTEATLMLPILIVFAPLLSLFFHAAFFKLVKNRPFPLDHLGA